MGALFRKGDRVRPRRRGITRRPGPPAAVAAGAVTCAVLCACGTASIAGTSSPADSVARGGTSLGTTSSGPVPDSTPPALDGAGPAATPPAGNQVQDVLQGKGVLVYRCDAGQYTRIKTSVKVSVEHGGFAGTQSGLLTWRFKNGTRVDATVVDEVHRPAALSQALLKVVKVTGGNANDRASTFIVRLPEPGQQAPTTCTTPGNLVSVPFQTRYVFYRSTPQP